MSPTFNIHAPLRAWKKAGSDHEMRIGGIVSTDGLDRQQERVVADGLDFGEFMSHGWFNDNHKQGTADVVGYPTSVKRVRKGTELPDGTHSQVNGWWAEGYLLDTTKGRDVWELTQSLQDSPRGLGFSIEGSVTKRSGSTIKAAAVRNVAVTHCPVNTETNLTALVKALSSGSSVTSPGSSAGEGFPLRTESLVGGDNPQDWYYDTDGQKRRTGTDELIEEPEERSPMSYAKSEASLGAVPSMTDTDLVESWAESLAAHGLHDDPANVTLTKSEAAIVARNWLPQGSLTERADLADCLTGAAK